MAKRLSNESPISEILKAFIENNKLQSGMDKIDVEKAWKDLMGNGVNTYTKEVILKGSTLYVSISNSSNACVTTTLQLSQAIFFT